MELLVLIVMWVLGFLTACVGLVVKLRVGTLKFASDGEGSPYMFLQLDDPDVTTITSKHYVVLKVDPNVVYSQE